MQLQRLAALLVALALGACAGRCRGCPPEREPVKSGEGSQSETAVNVSNSGGQQVIAVTYNDGTKDPKIQYTPTKRTVLAGASLMGSSYSTNDGSSWTYAGKVQPNAEWPILWGDPAITTVFNDQRYVFLSNLAVPQAKYPTGGVVSEGGYNGFYSAIGGACIARSTNAGQSFAVYQCVSNANHFYDGGSMAASNEGVVYASFVDVTESQIDVWRAPNVNGAFERIARPFAGMTMYSHPRLRYDAATRSLYAAAVRLDAGESGTVFINRLQSGGWGQPVPAGAGVRIYPTISLSDRTLRTGPQFAFDVGAPSQNQNDDLRLLYTKRDSRTGRLYLAGTMCTRDLVCKDAPGWATGAEGDPPQGDTFNPNVRAFPGFFGLEPAWRANYISRRHDPSGNTVKLKQGNLIVLTTGARVFLSFDLSLSQTVCSDTRGYWGDYDDLQLVGFSSSTTTARFMRAFTDSFGGCTERTTYESKEVHAGTATYPE